MERFTATVVFPTPPLPEPTAIRLRTPGIGSLGGAPGAFGLIEPIVAFYSRSFAFIRGPYLFFAIVRNWYVENPDGGFRSSTLRDDGRAGRCRRFIAGGAALAWPPGSRPDPALQERGSRPRPPDL